jgi:hypothetical protein
MLRGSDAILNKEAVMIGGHLDHVGIDEDGKIYNGADDNASGSAVVLGIAQQMVKNNYKPKRSVIFAAWSGEEKGLLGSTAWCKRPTFSLEDIVVYYNLDMVGVGDVKLNLPGSYYADKVWNEIVQNTDSMTLKNVTSSRGGPGGSDHTPFLQKGVPAMFGITGGSHPDYHQPGDDPEKINVDVVQFVGDFMYHSIDIVANSSWPFISEQRNTIGKFKLSTIFNLAPAGYSTYQEILNGKEIDVSLVSFTDSHDETDSDRSFLKILRQADEAFRSNSTSKNYSFLQNPSEISGLTYQNKIGLIATIDLSAINYDELHAKILTKTGVKIGIVNRGAPFAKDSTDKNHICKTIADGGMAIILKELHESELSNVLLQVSKPVAIITSDATTFQSSGNNLIRSGKHLVVYSIHNNHKIKDIVDKIEELRKLWEDEYLAVTLEEVDQSSTGKLQELYIAVENRFKDNEFTNKLFSGNIRRFLQTAVQETQQTVSRGRPF